jgi:hypothetical protein
MALLAATSSNAKGEDQETSTSPRHKNPRLGRKNDLNSNVGFSRAWTPV